MPVVVLPPSEPATDLKRKGDIIVEFETMEQANSWARWGGTDSICAADGLRRVWIVDGAQGLPIGDNQVALRRGA